MYRKLFGFSLGTGISRAFGFIREIVIAHFFGASASLDAFWVSFRIANLAREMLAEGSIIPSFVPLFTDKVKSDQQAGYRFANTAICTVLTIALIISIFTALFAPYLVRIISPGFYHDTFRFNLATRLTRMMSPFLPIMVVATFFMGILNYFSRFFVTGIAPVLFNIGIIATSVIFAKYIGVYSIAIGVLIGGIGQATLQYHFLKSHGYRFRPYPIFSDPTVRRMLRLMLPVVISFLVLRLSSIINTIIASFLAVGSISYLEYAFRFIYLPVGMIGVTIANVGIPTFTRQFADTGSITQDLHKVLKFGILCSVAAITLLLIFAHPLCRIVYQHGAFTAVDTYHTSRVIRFYSFAILGMTLNRTFSSIFYALKEPTTPLKVTLIGVAIHLGVALTFVGRLGLVALPLGVSVSSISSSVIYGVLVKRRLNGR